MKNYNEDEIIHQDYVDSGEVYPFRRDYNVPVVQKDILAEYVDDAVKTASHVDSVKVNTVFLRNAINAFKASGTMLDQIKKNVFYGKPFDTNKIDNAAQTLHDIAVMMTIKDDKIYTHHTPEMYQTEINVNPDIFHGILGIATESAELLDLLESTDTNKLCDELGDINWYHAITVYGLDTSWMKIQKANIAKLKTRYPDKFDANRAINKNDEEERLALDDVLGEDQ